MCASQRALTGMLSKLGAQCSQYMKWLNISWLVVPTTV